MNLRSKAILLVLPQCLALFGRLALDRRIPLRRRCLLWGACAYLASPIDLIPDFIPVVGYLDDAALVAVVLAWILRKTPGPILDELWPGDQETLQMLRSKFVGSSA